MHQRRESYTTMRARQVGDILMSYDSRDPHNPILDEVNQEFMRRNYARTSLNHYQTHTIPEAKFKNMDLVAPRPPSTSLRHRRNIPNNGTYESKLSGSRAGSISNLQMNKTKKPYRMMSRSRSKSAVRPPSD